MQDRFVLSWLYTEMHHNEMPFQRNYILLVTKCDHCSARCVHTRDNKKEREGKKEWNWQMDVK